MKLTQDQIEGIARQVTEDWRNGIANNALRIDRDRRFLKLFENLPDATGESEIGYRVPLVTETIKTKVAKMLAAILGPDRKIYGMPQGPSDGKQSRKVAAFVDWAAFQNIDPARELAKGLFRKEIFGRAFWYVPWEQEFDLEGELIWEGHRFISVGPGDLLHSNEPGKHSIQEFEWVAMRYFETHRSLVNAIQSGEYPLLTLDDLGELTTRTARWNDESGLGLAEDESEGVDRDNLEPSGDATRPVARGVIPMIAWYGWIETSKGKFEHVCVRKPDAVDAKVGSISLLKDEYRGMNNPRPFLETSDLSHSGYYPKSTAAWIEPAEETLTRMFRDFYKGGRFSACPPILADRETADQLDQQRYDPGDIKVVADPSRAVQMKIGYDPTFYQIGSTMVRADRDRTVGYSDYNAGRDISSPTAPKTASMGLALLQESNARMDLDMQFLAQDMSAWFKHIWQLWCTKADPNIVFRVTEQDLGDATGSAKMFEMPEERAGRYDFRLRFAPGPMEVGATREDVITAYQLGLQNPLVMQSPRAMYRLTMAVLRVLKMEEVASEVVEPPDNTPMPPDRENSMMLQGEKPVVKVADDHELHIAAHYRLIDWQRRSARPDQQAIQMAVEHIAEHNGMKRQIVATQAAINNTIENLQGMDAGLRMPVTPLPLEQVMSGAASNQMAQGATQMQGGGGE